MKRGLRALASVLFAMTFVVLCAPGTLSAQPETLRGPAPDEASSGDPEAPRQSLSERHYRSGLELFENGDRNQALVEFRIANELFPSVDIVFMMAQCEYHVGRLVEARAHYQAYVDAEKDGALAEIARIRIAAIERRDSVFVINSSPDDVRVELQGPAGNYVGQAPNEFRVPRGRYRIIVTKKNFQREEREVEVGIAETKSLFFGLKAVPARLTVRTHPAKATLFVRGMLAANPYKQNVEAGEYEIYAQADRHEAHRSMIRLRPGDDRTVTLNLSYVPRSGRSELLTFWSLAGGAVGMGAVASLLEPGDRPFGATSAASLTVKAGGAAVGAVTGLLVANAFTPEYIKDNLALFRIGGMWTMATEGVLLGLAVRQDGLAAWLGGGAGLGVGAALGGWMDRYAPSYGRVAMIQSAAVTGLMAGALTIPSFGLEKKQAHWSLLGGLNLGLAAGLTMAYGPDRHSPGPSWQRVLLVDLAGLAGTFAGAVVSALGNCSGDHCAFSDDKTTGRFALVGGGLGLLAGYLLTMDNLPKLPSSGAHRAGRQSTLPMPGPVSVVDSAGRVQMVPGMALQGLF